MGHKILLSSLVKEKRIDQYLSSLYRDYSRQFIKNLLEEGKIKIQGKLIKPSASIKEKDEIEIEIPEVKKLSLTPINLNLELVYEDDDLLVVNKPANLSVHPSASEKNPSLVEGLLYQVKTLSSINGVERPGIVHRIDKNTTGLLLVAKNDLAHQNLALQFSKRTIDRTYIAINCGVFKKLEGTIESYIVRNDQNRMKFMVSGHKGKKATSHYRVLKTYPKKFSMVEYKLATGRTHQIRVHSQFLGHPILNDALYGNKTYEKNHLSHEALQKLEHMKAHFLHAKSLGFVHPKTLKKLYFEVDLPEEFSKFLEYLL